jgi:hypothetical protein
LSCAAVFFSETKEVKMKSLIGRVSAIIFALTTANASATVLVCSSLERPMIVIAEGNSKDTICMNVWIAELERYLLFCDVKQVVSEFSASRNIFGQTFSVKINTASGKGKIHHTKIKDRLSCGYTAAE